MRNRQTTLRNPYRVYQENIFLIGCSLFIQPLGQLISPQHHFLKLLPLSFIRLIKFGPGHTSGQSSLFWV